ncbi:hypothetical protein Tco_1358690 [Tanacetum coccineum]
MPEPVRRLTPTFRANPSDYFLSYYTFNPHALKYPVHQQQTPDQQVLMTIGNVKGRWLDNSDGVHDINNTNQNNDSFLRMSVPDQGPKKLDASGNRCQPIYGFLPCADTVQEGIFLIVMYTYVLMLGEDWLKKGSKALLIHFMNQSIAGSVFRVLMALPRIVLVIGKLPLSFIHPYITMLHIFFMWLHIRLT